MSSTNRGMRDSLYDDTMSPLNSQRTQFNHTVVTFDENANEALALSSDRKKPQAIKIETSSTAGKVQPKSVFTRSKLSPRSLMIKDQVFSSNNQTVPSVGRARTSSRQYEAVSRSLVISQQSD